MFVCVGDRHISAVKSYAVDGELGGYWRLVVSLSSKATFHDDGVDSRTCTQH